MKPIRKTLLAAAALAALVVPQIAGAAPRPWMLPSDTMFVGNADNWMTVDAAISTDLYFYDHPGQDWKPMVTAPDGTQVPVENENKGRLRQTFDVHLTQNGTYKIAIDNVMVMGSYMLNGERKMLPRGTTPETLASAVPQGATEVWSAENRTRIETFATAGEPTDTVFKPTGKGIEMVPVTNPTDLAAGEPATFQFLVDGKPVADLAVTAVNGGVRYTNGLQQLDFKTGADGKVTIDFPQAGMWWVSASTGGRRGPGGEGGGPGGPGGPGGGEGGQRAQGQGPGPQGAGEGPPRPMGPPQPRSSYAMTVQVL